MSREIKAIETVWNGYRFRSRTEARWAVFFTSIGIGWSYEDEGFQLSDCKYLPDFRLVVGSSVYYCEVKKEGYDEMDSGGVDHEKFRKFVMETGNDLIILSGPPNCRIYNRYTRRLLSQETQFVIPVYATVFQDYGDMVSDGTRFLQIARLDEKTGELNLDFDERRMRKAFGRGHVKALYASRAERFGT